MDQPSLRAIRNIQPKPCAVTISGVSALIL
jgi:hypothetical protein